MSELLSAPGRAWSCCAAERGGKAFEIAARAFPGEVVEFAMRDPRTRPLSRRRHARPVRPAPLLCRRPGRANGSRPKGPAFPASAGAAVERIWVIEPGVGRRRAVVRRGAGGAVPQRRRRQELGAGAGAVGRARAGAVGTRAPAACACTRSARGRASRKRLAVGISAGGVWLTDDGGKSWRRGVEGLVPRYLPGGGAPRHARLLRPQHASARRTSPRPSTCSSTAASIAPTTPARAGSTSAPDRGLPSDFGFPLAIDPHDPDRAFVIPLAADMPTA